MLPVNLINTAEPVLALAGGIKASVQEQIVLKGIMVVDMVAYYNEDININKEIDGKAIYLIRLDPNKLMEIWAENNETTAEDICRQIGTTPEELYYNFGHTSNSINYANDHKSGKVSYSDIENEIFGEDNGEDRSIVFGTHFLYIDTAGKYKVTYESENDNFTVRQRDILKSTSEVSGQAEQAQ